METKKLTYTVKNKEGKIVDTCHSLESLMAIINEITVIEYRNTQLWNMSPDNDKIIIETTF